MYILDQLVDGPNPHHEEDPHSEVRLIDSRVDNEDGGESLYDSVRGT